MHEIKAIIRRERLQDVLEALHARAELPGVTISVVQGVGRRHVDETHESFGEVQLAKLETVVAEEMVDWIVETIRHAASTGRSGDGKIFVIPVERAVQIRSGRKGPDVL